MPFNLRDMPGYVDGRRRCFVFVVPDEYDSQCECNHMRRPHVKSVSPRTLRSPDSKLNMTMQCNNINFFWPQLQSPENCLLSQGFCSLGIINQDKVPILCPNPGHGSLVCNVLYESI